MTASLKALSLTLVSIILTGCATSTLWNEAGDLDDYKTISLLSDEMVALGKTTPPFFFLS